jgi:hypothetical protein
VVAQITPPSVRFWRKVEKQPGDGCWLWTGGKTREYGAFHPGPHTQDPKVYAHIFAWTEANGPVPEGKELDHACNTPLCVRPDPEKHVRPLTHAENRARSRLTVCRSGRHEITDETARWDKNGYRRGCLACYQEGQDRRRPRRKV